MSHPFHRQEGIRFVLEDTETFATQRELAPKEPILCRFSSTDTLKFWSGINLNLVASFNHVLIEQVLNLSYLNEALF